MPVRASRQADDELQERPDSRTPPDGEAQEIDPERIAQRAYERFQERGGEHGRDQEDWFEAEQELRGRRSE